MSLHRIIEKISFACQACGSSNLLSSGAVRTDQNKIYFTFTCEDCEEAVPVEIDAVMSELYRALKVPSSEKVH